MRKYKFRLWDQGIRKMVEIKAIDFDDVGNLYHINQKNINPCKVKVMQCTGLKDSRGVDIYEGDIVRIGSGEWKCKVYFSNEEQAFMLLDLDNKYAGSMNFMSQYSEYEVIGNVFENPELVKEED